VTDVPALVGRAEAVARRLGFPVEPTPDGPSCCLPDVGRLLAALAGGAGRIGEIGTGTGYGAAWMASTMPGEAGLMTVELDPERARAAAGLFEADDRVVVLQGEGLARLADHAPFDLLFLDGGSHSRDPAAFDAVVDLLAVGGHVVVDDVTPVAALPADSPWRTGDPKREAVLGHPRLAAVEVVCPDLRHSALLGTRTR
jgi:predicted O-methyltransferase YrrM